MLKEWIELPKADDFGMQVYRVAAAAADPAAPTVIVLHEIYGVNGVMCDVAEMLACEGFEVLVPDLFWRVEPRISLGYAEPDRTRATELMRGYDTDRGLVDVDRLIAWQKQRRGAGHRIGAIGFCIGGKLATLLGARGAIDAGVSFYGVQLDDYVDEIACAKSRLLLHFGGRDAQIPLALVERIGVASRGNPRVDVRLYPEAKHGFFNPSRMDRHDPDAAATARERTLVTLHEVLDSAAAS